MVDVVQTSLPHLENLANVIHKQMLMGKVLAVLHWDGVEIVQPTVIAQHVLITLKVRAVPTRHLTLSDLGYFARKHLFQKQAIKPLIITKIKNKDTFTLSSFKVVRVKVDFFHHV